ncbi:MAG TPA: hypothetical protein VKY57_02775, partial [Chitinispirillaceae bacterium]|nr:hypothetical protein [Chitinispirillaceae bacterium]
MKKQILTTVILIFVISTCVTGSVPKTLSYQGVVTDSNGNPKKDGEYKFTFSIFDDSISGKSLWSEEKTIQTKQGLFYTELGSVNPLKLPFDTQYWLQVKADGNVFPQRTKLTGTPYSFRADTAEIAKGLVDSFYTRDQLKTSGEAKVHAGNIVNAEWLDGNPFNQDLNTTDRVKFDGVINQNAGVASYHYKNVASYRSSSSSTKGTIKITMPQSWSHTMLTIKIAGYTLTQGWWECVVSGFNRNTGVWDFPECELRGNPIFSDVRLAHDGSKCCLLLGNTSISQQYLEVHITDVITGHSDYATWGTGWSIDLITDESGISNIATPDVDRPWHSGNLDTSKFSLKTDFNPDYFVQGENSFRRCNFDSSTQLDSNIFSTFLRLDANDPSS